MKQKINAVLLALFLITGLCSCKSGSKGSEKNDFSSDFSVTETDEEKVPEAKEETNGKTNIGFIYLHPIRNGNVF